MASDEIVRAERLVLPPATPTWITPELVARTLAVWQPFYRQPLALDDAIAMIVGVGRLADALLAEDSP